jgi:predicted transcriptional regulator
LLPLWKDRGSDMQLQNNTLKKFLTKYPKHSLADLSKLTGINKSRLFRIINGHEMKLREFESIQSHLKDDSSLPQNHFLETAKKCLGLNQEKLKYLTHEMNKILVFSGHHIA